MAAIRTTAAAAMLGVSPSTLRAWERKFGFPEPSRTAGGHRQYDLAQVEALRAAFAQTGSVSAAVALAQARGAGPASDLRLRDAYLAMDDTAADRLLEESLALRSVERTVGEVLLPALADLDGPEPTPELVVAWRHATGWLAAALRTTPPATRAEGVLLLDAAGRYEVDALRAQALELVLRRAGLRTLVLAATLEPTRMTRALTALAPRAVVLAGRHVELDALGRIVFAARRAGGEGVAVLDGTDALPAASTVTRLPADPLAARDVVLAHVGAAAPAARAAV